MGRFIPQVPPRCGPDLQLLEPLEGVLQELLEVDQRTYARSPMRCFGLEARVVHFLTEGEGPIQGVNPRKILIRPSVEPIIFSYWNRFKKWSIDDDSVLSLAGCLCGREIKYRTSIAASLPNDIWESALYPSPDIAGNWLSSLPTPREDSQILEGLSAAFHVLASFVCYHPLEDGNGRVGRALFQGALARCLGLSSPMLAVTPLVCFNAAAVIRGHRRLGAEGDWTEFVQAYHIILRDSLLYHKRVEEYL
ncbi:Fic/DOC family protein [compost metagenome]